MALNLAKADSLFKASIVSESSDFLKLSGENRLRALAKTIPSYGHHQPHTATQSCISATIQATQEYLSQLITGLSLTNPNLARFLVVSSSGLNVISWLERTKDSEHGWIPNYPVNGYITFGLLKTPPTYGLGPLEPAIQLSVNRSDDNGEDFAVDFIVSDAEHMRVLDILINDVGELWDQFETLFEVKPFSHIPLPEEVEGKPGTELRCRDYLSAFIKHVVDKADDEDSCLESFDLQFSVKNAGNLHGPIVAAIALFEAYSLYLHRPHDIGHEVRQSMVIDILKAAIYTGITTNWNEKEEKDNFL